MREFKETRGGHSVCEEDPNPQEATVSSSLAALRGFATLSHRVWHFRLPSAHPEAPGSRESNTVREEEGALLRGPLVKQKEAMTRAAQDAIQQKC